MKSNTLGKNKFQSKFSNHQKLWFLFKIVILTWILILLENLSKSNGIQTHKHLVGKTTLNHLAKLVSFAK